jgi:hypothetical protein
MRQRTAAFTLLELLVAATITLVMAGVMVAISTQTLVLWGKAQDTSTAATQAKIALDLIERDMQSAIARQSGGPWLALDLFDTFASATPHGWRRASGERIKPEGTSSRILRTSAGNKINLAQSRNGFSGSWLRFISTKLDSNTSSTSVSGPVAVGYQILRRGYGANPEVEPHYSLYRSEVSQSATFAEGYSIGTGNYNSASATDGTPGSIYSPTVSRLLATNVVDFGLRFYSQSLDADTGYSVVYPVDNDHTVYTLTGAQAPVAADIMLRILTGRGADQLFAIESGRVAMPPIYGTYDEWWWAIVEANSTVFVRRVQLRSSMP